MGALGRACTRRRVVGGHAALQLHRVLNERLDLARQLRLPGRPLARLPLARALPGQHLQANYANKNAGSKIPDPRKFQS